MKYKHSLLILLLEAIFCMPLCATNAVSSVDAHQEGQNIVITYQLSEQSDVTVSVSTNGGATYSSIKSVMGDVGTSVSAGSKSVVWNVLADYERFCFENVCFKVEGYSGFVDLGLPSGTRWAEKNEGGDKAFYTYDDAISKFGDNVPTAAQFEELADECTWAWTGKGYKVVGPNGKSIYLPAAGSSDSNDNIRYAGFLGKYWCSPSDGSVYQYMYGSRAAYDVFFNSVEVELRHSTNLDIVQSIRLVLP